MYECGWFSSTGQPWSHEYSRRLAAVCAPDVANTATLFAAIDGAFLPRTGWTLVGRWANSAPTIKERPANEIIVGYSLSARISKSFSPVKQGQIPIARREQIGGLIKYTFSILIMAATLCHGQGVFTVNFNGPPIVNPFTRQIVQQYDEAGMTFWSPTGEGFARMGPGPADFPENGSAYLGGVLPFSLSFKAGDDSLFGILGVDLAAYRTDVPDVTASFLGYRSDGSTVSTNFAVSGIAFHTYHFGPEFNNLTRVDVLSFGSLDNLVVLVPEPSTLSLLAMLGLPAFVLWRRGAGRR